MELSPPSLDLLRPAKKVSLLASIVPDFHDTKKHLYCLMLILMLIDQLVLVISNSLGITFHHLRNLAFKVIINNGCS